MLRIRSYEYSRYRYLPTTRSDHSDFRLASRVRGNNIIMDDIYLTFINKFAYFKKHYGILLFFAIVHGSGTFFRILEALAVL
jgi:hypothetical protein